MENGVPWRVCFFQWKVYLKRRFFRIGRRKDWKAVMNNGMRVLLSVSLVILSYPCILPVIQPRPLEFGGFAEWLEPFRHLH